MSSIALHTLDSFLEYLFSFRSHIKMFFSESFHNKMNVINMWLLFISEIKELDQKWTFDSVLEGKCFEFLYLLSSLEDKFVLLNFNFLVRKPKNKIKHSSDPSRVFINFIQWHKNKGLLIPFSVSFSFWFPQFFFFFLTFHSIFFIFFYLSINIYFFTLFLFLN